MKNLPLQRIDRDHRLHDHLMGHCRLAYGQKWSDPLGRHIVACMDATDTDSVGRLLTRKARLAVHDPPYNMIAFERMDAQQFIDQCRKWVHTTDRVLDENSSLYVWLGGDQKNHFEPLADFMIMMRSTPFQSRSHITVRNQRGYGTQKNWMAVRQELLYYTKGTPPFNVSAEYTDIPRVVAGYYKQINNQRTENRERSVSPNIRAGNVWVDIQQVFYRMPENVNGCYAQKPLKGCRRIIEASSETGDFVVDFFCHSGTTLIACEMLSRRCLTIDIDPVFCEIAIRRLEHFRTTGMTGWQNSNPFETDFQTDSRLRELAAASKRPVSEYKTAVL